MHTHAPLNGRHRKFADQRPETLKWAELTNADDPGINSLTVFPVYSTKYLGLFGPAIAPDNE